MLNTHYNPPQNLTTNQKYFYDVYLSMLERAVALLICDAVLIVLWIATVILY